MDERIGAVLRGRRLKRILRIRYSGLRKKYGITQMDVELLQYFSQNPGSAAIDVIRELDFNKGNVSTALFKMIQEGLVAGEPSEKDRRVIQYHLKEKGETIIREADEIRKQFLCSLFQGLTDEEKEVLQHIAVKVCDNLEYLESVSKEEL